MNEHEDAYPVGVFYDKPIWIEKKSSTFFSEDFDLSFQYLNKSMTHHHDPDTTFPPYPGTYFAKVVPIRSFSVSRFDDPPGLLVTVFQDSFRVLIFRVTDLQDVLQQHINLLGSYVSKILFPDKDITYFNNIVRVLATKHASGRIIGTHLNSLITVRNLISHLVLNTGGCIQISFSDSVKNPSSSTQVIFAWNGKSVGSLLDYCMDTPSLTSDFFDKIKKQVCESFLKCLVSD